MPEQQQREACAELARRMGWREGSASGIWFSPAGSLELCVYDEPPDYFNDPAASRELVAWLAKQECTEDYQDHECYEDGLCLPFGRFIAIVSNSWTVDRFCFSGHCFEVSLSGLSALLTLEPPVIAHAARKALGIEVE